MDPRLEEVADLPGATGPVRRFLDQGISASLNKAIADADIPNGHNWAVIFDAKMANGEPQADVQIVRKGEHWSVAWVGDWKQSTGFGTELQGKVSW